MLASLQKIQNKTLWEDFVKFHPQGCFLQSWDWGALHEKLSNKVVRLGMLDSGKIASGMQLFLRRAKRGVFVAIPGGPLINWQDSNEVELFFQAIKNFAKKHQVWFVRVRPNLTDQVSGQKIFKKYGFIRAPMPMHAESIWRLDITPSKDELLSNMRKATRYEIRRGQREDIKIRPSNNPKDAQTLFDLQTKTAQRKGFIPFDLNFLSQLLEVFAPDNQVEIFFSSEQEKVLAAALIIFYGKTAYYYVGASLPKEQKVPHTPFLLWRAILQAKERNLTYFNFMGIAPKDVRNHPWSKVTFFKQGFGGERRDYVAAQDLPLKPNYWLTYFFEKFQCQQRG
ncbi:MAG: peptidoglycan bridge formation glycyltransferase FemA/FemB family protein, partial [Candidatus Cloacimonetes bacterium]|nr:peptidoglycan bridge formation glycyltransferase FemA/FemB family protein [Candidatus Cloacimonadota bacterium]